MCNNPYSNATCLYKLSMQLTVTVQQFLFVLFLPRLFTIQSPNLKSF